MKRPWYMDIPRETYSAQAIHESREKWEAEHPDPYLNVIECAPMPKDQISFISVENGRLVEKARIVGLGDPPG
jgi:hypothetical protein